MENLSPTQFYYLLAKIGLDVAINILLPPLKDENLNKYSAYKSYLNGARFYEFSKAFRMYLDIKEKLLSKYKKELNDLSSALFILKELVLRLDISIMYNGIYHKERVQEMLVIWKNQQPIIEPIKARWWDFGNKRELINQIKLYKQTARSFFSKETAKEYNLL